MHPRSGPASEALRAYMTGDNLIDTARVEGRWDEQGFVELLRVARACLEEIAEDEFIPRHVAAFFGNLLLVLDGVLQQPEFIVANRGARTMEQAQRFFARRREILLALRSWMASGGRPYGPERFELGD